MLKRTININEKIDISKYERIAAFLKIKSQELQCKQSNVFKPEEISDFIRRAPDEFYLATKVDYYYNLIKLLELFITLIIN